MGISLRVLFIEDSEDDAILLLRMLRQAGYDVEYTCVDSRKALLEAINQTWDIIISDYSLPQFTGVDALRLVREKGLDVPFIFVSGTIGEETAVSALRLGAQDYLMKTNLSRFIAAVQRELREAEERRQRRRMEHQMQQLQRFEAIGRLAGGVAHDFNNVIGAIMGWADMGFNEADPGSLLQDRFRKIRSQADRAGALTRQLLAFARRQVLQPSSINLNDLIKDQITLLANVIGERINIESQLSDGLWNIGGDPGQLEQIIMNLCLNARDAMPEGGRLLISTANVEIDKGYNGGHADAIPGRYTLLLVSDTGAGMDGAVLEHIFEPFFTTKEVGKGTGLGLATVYGIVRQHKGFIDVDSTPDAGTTFRVFLPAGDGIAQKPADKIVEGGLRTGTETILVAEDNEDLRNTTKEILEGLGYRVHAAADGRAALLLFEKLHPAVDLVLLDVIMPGLNGLEAYARMRAIQPTLPAILATGYVTDNDAAALYSQENATILEKPYGSKDLALRVREMLDGHKASAKTTTRADRAVLHK